MPNTLGSELKAQKKVLRQQLREKRHSLSRTKQLLASLRICQRIVSSAQYKQAQSIACYLANDGEISLLPLAKHAWQRRKACFLPLVNTNDSLSFVEYSSTSQALKNNRFGIPEPRSTAKRMLRETLDLVFMPLVGFDRFGARLGMGGGYYDRCFAKNKRSKLTRESCLIGCAHQVQICRKLPVESWDVSLDAVITDQRSYSGKRQSM